MKNIKLFLLGLFAFSSVSSGSFAADTPSTCTTVDFRSEMGPIRNQGDSGWCYANAMSDLLGYYFKAQLGGRQVSADYLALKSNYDSYRSAPSGGGFMGAAVRLGEAKGMCAAPLDQDLSGKDPMKLVERLKDLENMKSLYDKKDMTGLQAKINEFNEASPFFSKLNENDVLELLKSNVMPRNFPEHLADLYCAKNLYTPGAGAAIPHTLFAVPLLNNYLFETIDGQLAQHNIIGIGYQAEFLVDNKFNPISGHASVVVGRRWNTDQNRCEYMVRNSWGTSFKYTNAVIDLKDGNYYVPQKTLAKYLSEVTYIPKN